LLPPGLPVGRLIVQSGRYRTALFADVNSGGDVEVLDFKGVPEVQPAPSPADLPAMPATIPVPRATAAPPLPANIDGNE
jgi:hypothetical protein